MMDHDNEKRSKTLDFDTDNVKITNFNVGTMKLNNDLVGEDVMHKSRNG